MSILQDKYEALVAAGWTPSGQVGFTETDAGGGGTSFAWTLANGVEVAVYQHPATGAHEVHGAILERYRGEGGPRGALGFPTADEADVVTGGSVTGRVSTFTGGTVAWDSASGRVTVTTTAPAPGGDAPARSLTRELALAELLSLASAGTIALEGAPSARRVDLDGLDPVSGRPLAGCVAGVIITGTNGRPNAPDRLDPRNALALVRLCVFLSGRFGATHLTHAGIDGSDPTVRSDCHGQGRAVDFTGAARRAGTAGDFAISVKKDWGAVSTSATPGGDWPAGTGRAVHYRLAGQGTFAERFFAEVYGFIAGQWQDRGSGPAGAETPTAIGQGGFIMHPDHPDSNPAQDAKNGREAHRDHIHMQIGVTGNAAD